MNNEPERTGSSHSIFALMIFLLVFNLAALSHSHFAIARQQELQSSESDESKVMAEFRAISERLKASNNQYYGRAVLDQLLRRDTTRLSGLHLVNHHLTLSWHHLRCGNVEESIREVESAFDYEDLPRFPKSYAYMSRALSYLRLAEVKNCIERNNCDCCIFPLTGGGVHLDPKPAQAAKRDLLQYLKYDSKNLHVVWILNLLSMAIGDYPEGVPERFRIPASAFESDVDFVRFKDVAGELGINTYNLSGGAIVEDFDGDRKLDIVTSTYDPDGHLTFYRNVADGTFEDASVHSKLNQQFGGLNCIAADYDNDGDKDIVVLRGAWLEQQGEIRNSLLQNDGKGRFTDVTKRAGLAEQAYPTQAAVWGDFNGDALLDLYIVNESRAETRSASGYYPAQLFINQGDGTFLDEAVKYGVTNDRFAKGVTAGDFDNDGDLDIYVSNIGANRLYRNEGSKFSDVAVSLGVHKPDIRSFATWFFDYNNDGWLDLFVAAYYATPSQLTKHYLGMEHGAARANLYRNRGDGTFVEVGAETGFDFPCLPMGANFGDLDNDGYLDVYLTTGDPLYQTLMPNVMLKNDQGTKFQDVTTAGGFGHLQKGHGVAFADIDDDGDQDIYHQLGGFFPGDKFHNVLFENPGMGNRFLILKLIGKSCNRDAVGARVEVKFTENGKERSVHRALGSVSSFGGSPSRLEIGLGTADKIVAVKIRWPGSGGFQDFDDLDLDSLYRIQQGSEAEKIEFISSKWSAKK